MIFFSRSDTELNTPRRICFSVINPKNRSTRFSHEELVGMNTLSLGRNINGFEIFLCMPVLPEQKPVDQLNRRACGGARLSWISTPESIGAFFSK